MRAVVYTQENCQPCKATKRHLIKLGASWVEKPITDENRRQFQAQGLRSAPIVEVYDDEYDLQEVWTQYDPDKIDHHFKGEK